MFDNIMYSSDSIFDCVSGTYLDEWFINQHWFTIGTTLKRCGQVLTNKRDLYSNNVYDTPLLAAM